MERVTGIGGVFFKSQDVAQLGKWYAENLGVPMEEWGGTTFEWRHRDDAAKLGHTVFSLFKSDSDYFGPGEAPFMVNFRVADLDAMLDQLRAKGCAVAEKVEESEFGRFGWVTDPEGHRVELWEPPAGPDAPLPDSEPPA
jgi:predicted enzyme related to lactoylglutathione lyase